MSGVLCFFTFYIYSHTTLLIFLSSCVLRVCVKVFFKFYFYLESWVSLWTMKNTEAQGKTIKLLSIGKC